LKLKLKFIFKIDFGTLISVLGGLWGGREGRKVTISGVLRALNLSLPGANARSPALAQTIEW
jgi:H+/Cl- antiporter ClcA